MGISNSSQKDIPPVYEIHKEHQIYTKNIYSQNNYSNFNAAPSYVTSAEPIYSKNYEILNPISAHPLYNPNKKEKQRTPQPKPQINITNSDNSILENLSKTRTKTFTKSDKIKDLNKPNAEERRIKSANRERSLNRNENELPNGIIKPIPSKPKPKLYKSASTSSASTLQGRNKPSRKKETSVDPYKWDDRKEKSSFDELKSAKSESSLLNNESTTKMNNSTSAMNNSTNALQNIYSNYSALKKQPGIYSRYYHSGGYPNLNNNQHPIQQQQSKYYQSHTSTMGVLAKNKELNSSSGVNASSNQLSEAPAKKVSPSVSTSSNTPLTVSTPKEINNEKNASGQQPVFIPPNTDELMRPTLRGVPAGFNPDFASYEKQSPDPVLKNKALNSSATPKGFSAFKKHNKAEVDADVAKENSGTLEKRLVSRKKKAEAEKELPKEEKERIKEIVVTKKKDTSSNRVNNELDAAAKVNPYSNNSREGEYYYHYHYYHHHHRHHHPHSHQQPMTQPTPQYLPFNNEKMVMLY